MAIVISSVLRPDTPDIEALALFVGVAELGSLGAAARAHGVTQPAVSMRMQRLERDLGLRLLRRTPTGTTLTPAGASVVDWARRVVDASAAMLAGVDALREVSGRRLRIASSLTMAVHLVPTWLLALRAGQPDVAMSLEVANSTGVAELVLAGKVQVGFVEGPEPADPGLAQRVVGEDRLVVVVAPGHPWAHRRAVDPAELASEPLLLREEGSGTRLVLELALAPYGGIASPSLELGSSTAIVAAVRRGAGPAVLSSLAVVDDVSLGRMAAVAVEGLDLGRFFRALWARGQRLEPIARKLVEIAASSAGSPGITSG